MIGVYILRPNLSQNFNRATKVIEGTNLGGRAVDFFDLVFRGPRYAERVSKAREDQLASEETMIDDLEKSVRNAALGQHRKRIIRAVTSLGLRQIDYDQLEFLLDEQEQLGISAVTGEVVKVKVDPETKKEQEFTIPAPIVDEMIEFYDIAIGHLESLAEERVLSMSR
jgi:hypothetical protein